MVKQFVCVNHKILTYRSFMSKQVPELGHACLAADEHCTAAPVLQLDPPRKESDLVHWHVLRTPVVLVALGQPATSWTRGGRATEGHQ